MQKRKTNGTLAVLLLLMLLAVTFAVSACGNGDVPPTDTTGTETEGETVTDAEAGKYALDARYVNMLEDSAADPFILCRDNSYYLYSTGTTSISVRISTNLRSFTKMPDPALKLSSFSWAKDNCWAPEVYEYGGKYYIVFSARGKNGIYAIDIGVSSSPEGPFLPLLSSPLYAPSFSVIDASLLFDDGRVYLFFSKDCSTNVVNGKNTSQTYGVELKEDLSGILGEPKLLATPEKSWETGGGTLWNEGPVVIHQNGKYYLLYSANYYKDASYSVGYAVSDSPLGTYVKPENNRILYGDGKNVTGTGHCNYFLSPDGSEIYLCYHRHTIAPTSDNGRSLCIDKLVFEEDGCLYVDGPSTNVRPVPSGVNGYSVLHGGYTVAFTEEEMRASGKIDYLSDGKITGKQLNVRDAATITVTFDEATALYGMMIYATAFSDFTPDTVDVLVNGTWRMNGVAFPTKAGNPAMLSFNNLPEGTEIRELRLTFHQKADADDDTFLCLNEFVFTCKN